ncbi:transposable element Tc1 transposase [Trichonephila clavipes]|nr:transposable element Tc1 transposase [Trichonephila clavipes]
MESKSKEISISERKIIVKMWKDGKSRRDIARSVGRQYSPIQPQIATDVHEKFNKSICGDTARKISKKAGYRSRVARRKLYISMSNRLKRIAFVKEHINKPPEFRRTIIFSEESKFCIFGIKGRKLLWRKPCTELQKEQLVPTVKHGGGGIMAWGESATKLGLGSSFSFQHDNDPKHSTELVKLWQFYKVPKQLHKLPQSPDLNPVEHPWNLLERKIRQHSISSKDMLKSVLKDEWEKISAEETT